MLTDEQYSDLSRNVYRVDPRSDKHLDIHSGDVVVFISPTRYQIIDVTNNPANGFQAMAVAPIRNGKPDYSSTVIAFAGTNPQDFKDLKTDLNTVVQGANTSGSQAADALRFSRDIQSKVRKLDPNAGFSTTGHSLGGYEALYVSGELQLPSVSFNAPDPSNILSKTGKAWVDQHRNALTNYRSSADLIGDWGGDGTDAQVLADRGRTGMTTLMWISSALSLPALLLSVLTVGGKATDAHSLDRWKFDADGNAIVEGIGGSQTTLQSLFAKLLYRQRDALRLLSSTLNVTGGTMSSSARLYVEQAGVLGSLRAARLFCDNGLDDMASSWRQDSEMAQNEWATMTQSIDRAARSTSTSAFSAGTGFAPAGGSVQTVPEMGDDEIQDILIEEGATHKHIVDDRTDRNEGNLAILTSLLKGYDDLIAQIASGMRRLLDADGALASRVRAMGMEP